MSCVLLLSFMSAMLQTTSVILSILNMFGCHGTIPLRFLEDTPPEIFHWKLPYKGPFENKAASKKNEQEGIISARTGRVAAQSETRNLHGADLGHSVLAGCCVDGLNLIESPRLGKQP